MAIAEAMANLEVRQTQGLVEEVMPAGVSPIRTLDVLREGVRVDRQRFAPCECFVSDLIVSGQIMKNADDEKREKCVFIPEPTRLSSRAPAERIPSSLKGEKVKIARYCPYDWHYELDIEKTLEPDETEPVLEGKPSGTMYW